jgi:membrane protein implicated in regulation of membrane protease activity
MKNILIVVFSVMVLASLGGWAQTSSQKTEKSSTTATTTTSTKAMNMTGTVSSDGKMFVADKDNKSWKIGNPEEVKAHEGHHVSINANEDAATDTVHVNSVKMLGKTKTATPSNSGGNKY